MFSLAVFSTRNGMIGFGTKIRHRGGTPEIDSSGRGAGSAIGVHRICKSNVFAWRIFDFFGDVRSQMAVFEKTTGLRNHVGKKMSIFYYVFPRLSSRPTVSPRRDDSRCHQVPVFPDQNWRHAPRSHPKAPLPTPRGPLIASSVWGIKDERVLTCTIVQKCVCMCIGHGLFAMYSESYSRVIPQCMLHQYVVWHPHF